MKARSTTLRHVAALGAVLLVSSAAATVALADKPEERGDQAHGTHAERGRPSDHTLKEVMQHLAASEQQIQMGLLMNNRLMVLEGAKAIAHHPSPKGGIKPYIKKNHAALKPTIQAMDKQVHSTAVSIAKQAGTASMLELQELHQTMVKGCISCHNVFRD